MSQPQEVSRRSCRVLIKEIHKKDHAKIQKLLQGGANLHGTDYNGDTPLHHAVASRDLDIVRLLLDRGADVNAENECGYRPYNIALNEHFLEALDALLQDNAVIAELDRRVSCLPRNMVDLFYDKVDLQSHNVGGLTALHVVADIDDIHAARRLLSRGADAGAESLYEQQTPLHFATSRDMAELLLDHGSPIDALDRYDVTPLSVVAVRNPKRFSRVAQSEIIALLVDRGAEVSHALVSAEQQLDHVQGFDEMHGFKDVLKFVALKEDEHGFSERIDRDEFSRFYNQAVAEVEQMRSNKFYCNVSFREFLVRSLQRRITNIDVLRVGNVEKVGDLKARFPLYCEILKRHVDDAQLRYMVRNLAKFAFNYMCPKLKSVHVVVDEILGFLEKTDMLLLLRAFNQCF